MWLHIAISVITFLLLLVFHLVQMKKKYSSISHFPGPKGLFLLGNALDMGANSVELLNNAKKFTQLYGKYFQTWIGTNHPIIWVSDVKIIEFILSSAKYLDKSNHYQFIHKWLGEGLLIADAEKWKKSRKCIAPAFHFKVLEEFVQVFNKCGSILIEKLSKEIDKNSQSVLNIEPFITLCALDMICETTMGTSINAQQNANSPYVQAVQNLCNILLERTFSAWKRFDLLFRFTKSYKIQNQSLAILHDFTRRIINQKQMKLALEGKQELKMIEEEGNDLGLKKKMALLDLLLKTSHEGEKLTDDEIRNQIDTFMFAGHDTVTSAINFALYEIARHPDIQQKLVDEIYSILGDDTTKQPTYQELTSMKYLELVIKETLRLYPSVPFYSRQIKENFIFEGTTFPAGLTIIFNIFMLHRDPEIYEEPDKFIPERFLQEEMKGKSFYSYLPFSSGLRNCIGQKFAMVEMKATICKILHNFQINSVAGHKLILSAQVVLKSTSGICIQLEARNNKHI